MPRPDVGCRVCSGRTLDEDQLHRPAHWYLGFIRRFMIVFGPLGSLFDFLTFAVMLWVFHAQAAEFRSGWFVESLATQTLVIFAIRTQAGAVRAQPPQPAAHPGRTRRRGRRGAHNNRREPNRNRW
jgi:hypothetical protein